MPASFAVGHHQNLFNAATASRIAAPRPDASRGQDLVVGAPKHQTGNESDAVRCLKVASLTPDGGFLAENWRDNQGLPDMFNWCRKLN